MNVNMCVHIFEHDLQAEMGVACVHEPKFISTYLHMKLQAELGVVSIVGSGILTVVGFQLRQLTAFLYDGVTVSP